mmetsp:Transcript_2687/g.8034  ORF Transcript_2687/g.8034 Transcript_2687/m.8034 type:complete len:275 (-) Transcript_2687:467-1291(-)
MVPASGLASSAAAPPPLPAPPAGAGLPGRWSASASCSVGDGPSAPPAAGAEVWAVGEEAPSVPLRQKAHERRLGRMAAATSATAAASVASASAPAPTPAPAPAPALAPAPTPALIAAAAADTVSASMTVIRCCSRLRAFLSACSSTNSCSRFSSAYVGSKRSTMTRHSGLSGSSLRRMASTMESRCEAMELISLKNWDWNCMMRISNASIRSVRDSQCAVMVATACLLASSYFFSASCNFSRFRIRRSMSFGFTGFCLFTRAIRWSSRLFTLRL